MYDPLMNNMHLQHARTACTYSMHLQQRPSDTCTYSMHVQHALTAAPVGHLLLHPRSDTRGLEIKSGFKHLHSGFEACFFPHLEKSWEQNISQIQILVPF